MGEELMKGGEVMSPTWRGVGWSQWKKRKEKKERKEWIGKIIIL